MSVNKIMKGEMSVGEITVDETSVYKTADEVSKD